MTYERAKKIWYAPMTQELWLTIDDDEWDQCLRLLRISGDYYIRPPEGYIVNERGNIIE